jgi:hypothetical protein
VKRADLADVYPVQVRRLSLSSLIAAIVPAYIEYWGQVLDAACRNVADRDVYTCFPDGGEQPQLIDRLEELGYPVDRKAKTYRLSWGNEA